MGRAERCAAATVVTLVACAALAASSIPARIAFIY